MNRIIITVASVIAALAIFLGLSIAQTGTALAAPPGASTPSSAVEPARVDRPGRMTAGCGGGRCTVYLSNAETRALGNGSVPAPPAFLPLPIRVAYYALAYAHRYFASQYAARGWCSLFRLTIYPWESAGYMGYRCP